MPTRHIYQLAIGLFVGQILCVAVSAYAIARTNATAAALIRVAKQVGAEKCEYCGQTKEAAHEFVAGVQKRK